MMIMNRGLILAIIAIYASFYIDVGVGDDIQYETSMALSSYNSRNLQYVCKSTDAMKQIIDEPDISCIDGTRPGYYIRRGSDDGVNKWHVHFEGDGWCYSLRACIKRSKTGLGSSMNWPDCMRQEHMKHYESSSKERNPLMYNWNVVHIKYCDGSSYSGESMIEFDGNLLYFKGKNNRDAFIRNILSAGMDKATDIVLSGCSAGGLGIFFGLDDMSEQIRKVNPSAKIRGMADSGYFLDLFGEDYEASLVKMKDDVAGDRNLDHSGLMRRVFSFTGMAAGVDRNCLKSHDKSSDYTTTIDQFHSTSHCAFADAIISHVQTPLFMIQPQYDQWQILHIYRNPKNYTLVNQLGRRLVQEVEDNFLNKPQHGAFFDACTHHCTGCSRQPNADVWNGDFIMSSKSSKKGSTSMNVAKAFSLWYYDDSIDVMNSTRINGKISAGRKHAHIQKGDYPCTSCCKCVF